MCHNEMTIHFLRPEKVISISLSKHIFKNIYQLWIINFIKKQTNKKIYYQLLLIIKFGRGGEIRTPDPLVPNQMRYQTALRPDMLLLI